MKGYMCKVDYDFELGKVSDGVKVYPTVSCLKENSGCGFNGECGIVEVEVKLKRIVNKGFLDGNKSKKKVESKSSY